MANFGYETIGADWLQLNHLTGLAGSWYALTEPGTINSITAYIGTDNVADDTLHYSFALYNSSYELLAQTSEELHSYARGYGWRTLNLLTPYAASAANYWLVIWSEGSAAYGKRYGLEANKGFRQTGLTYNSWPSPFTPTLDYSETTIYATYTAGGGAIIKIINE